MNIETALAIIGALLNVIIALLIKGMRSELRLIRSDLSGEHRILAEHVNGHVEQRLKQTEAQGKDHEDRLRTLEAAVAALPRRKTDRQGD